jgi:hypothetical protein
MEVNVGPLQEGQKYKFLIFERRILRMVYVSINDGGIRRTRYNIVQLVKIGRLRWLGQLFRMHKMDPCRKLIVLKPEGTRRIGKPKVRWLKSIEEDLQKMGLELET